MIQKPASYGVAQVVGIPGGYRNVHFQGRLCLEHRVIWFLYYGVWPKSEIDHINGDRGDNRITNLRLATRSENGQNRKMPANNSSGHKGVTWVRSRKMWQAAINTGHKPKFLGRFATREEAAAAYDKAALEHHGEFAKIDL